MALNKYQTMELALRTRHGAKFKFDLEKALEIVQHGLEKGPDEPIEFIKHYAFIRDLSLAAPYAKHLQKQGFSKEQLEKCSELVREIETKKSEKRTEFTLFYQAKEAPFDRQALEELFKAFVSKMSPTHRHR